MEVTVTNFKNDCEGTMEIGFSTGESFIVKYDPMGFGIGIIKLMMESSWKRFEGTPTEFAKAVEKMLEN